MEMNLEKDFRNILMDEFKKRARKNPSYSLRAFARDLEISSAHLSQVFRGKEGLSPQKAEQIAEKLFQRRAEVRYFCDLVESQHARSSAGRKAAQKALGSLWSAKKKELSTSEFKKVCRWYHLAILHLTELRSFRSDPKWISQYLGIDMDLAKTAVQDLMNLNLLENTATGLKKKSGILTHSDKLPSPVIREYHRQMINKALVAIDTQDLSERFLTSTTFSVRKSQIPEIYEVIKKLISETIRASDTPSLEEPDELYALNVQLFNLKERSQ